MNRYLLSTTMLGLVATGALVAAQSTTVSPRTFPPITLAHSDECFGECVPCRQGCKIEVFLQGEGKECNVKGLTKVHKIWHIKPRQKATYVFHNACAQAVEVGVGDFGPHPKGTCTVPLEHPQHEKEWPEEVAKGKDHFTTGTPALGVAGVHRKDPFVDGPRSVHVDAGHEVKLPLTLISDPRAPRTYKYAIMVNGKPELDPEIEIER